MKQDLGIWRVQVCELSLGTRKPWWLAVRRAAHVGWVVGVDCVWLGVGGRWVCHVMLSLLQLSMAWDRMTRCWVLDVTCGSHVCRYHMLRYLYLKFARGISMLYHNGRIYTSTSRKQGFTCTIKRAKHPREKISDLGVCGLAWRGRAGVRVRATTVE